jgi:hypothetical protein
MHGPEGADYSASWNLQPSTYGDTSGQSGYDTSGHYDVSGQSGYDTSGHHDASGYSFVTDSIHPQYYIEPSEREDYSPIPDVHRQSTSSEDGRSVFGKLGRGPSQGPEDASLHGTFGLGTRPSSRRMDSAMSEGRWTTGAEYDQSTVAYELYETDPDTSRPDASYYPRPMSSTPPPMGRAPRSHSPHPDTSQGRNGGAHSRVVPPGSARSRDDDSNQGPRHLLPALSIPQPHYPPAPHPSLHEGSIHPQQPPPHQQGPLRRGSVQDEHGPRELPRRRPSSRVGAGDTQSGAGLPPEQQKRARDRSATRRHEDSHPAPGPGRTAPPSPPQRPFSPEDISVRSDSLFPHS